MINVIIVADDAADDIGANCALALQHLSKSVDFSGTNLQVLVGEQCVAESLQKAISSLGQKSFVFVAFSHGSENALISKAAANGYLTPLNAYFFGSSFVYTTSCFTARELKQALIDSSCDCYVGYEDQVWLPSSIEDEIVFIDCENKGLVLFLTEDLTLSEAVEKMKKHYLQVYSSYLDRQEYVTAGLLRKNMDSLVHYERVPTSRSYFEN